MIEVKALGKTFGKNELFKDLHFQLEKGKCYGLLGENGAGKTTLFRCLLGLENHEGSIISEFNPIKNHTGYLETEPYFFPKITGREYIRLLCNARGLTEVDITKKNIFDLPLHQYASTYSTGMKKKLALTAILLQQNDFFILDEPFNGLDIESNLIMIEIILKLKQLRKTILLSSHIFSTLSETCDEIYHLKKGNSLGHIFKSDFSQLEASLKSNSFANRLDRLHLM